MSEEKVRCMIGVVCLLLAGCASTPTATGVPYVAGRPPLATETQAPTENAAIATNWARYLTQQATITAQASKPTRTPRPTQEAEPTSAPIFTAPPVPSVVPTATPSAPLSTSGPWLVGKNTMTEEWDYLSYLWAANPDMSGLTRLIPEPVIAYAIRPTDTIGSGLTIAYATKPFEASVDITLKIVVLPGGEPQTIASLYQAAADSEFSKYYLEAALAYDGLVWSPDGRTLAFAGGLSGLSVDVYTYSLDTGEIKQLSSGSLHAFRLRWSPDGRYIVYESSDMMGMGGPYAEGVWAVPAGGGPNISLVDKDLGYFDYHEYGWLSPTQILLGTTYYDARDSIQAVNIETGAIDYITHAQYDRGAYSPEHQLWLLARTHDVEGLGTALILCRSSDCQIISSNKVWSVWWSSSRGVFFSVGAQGELYQITPEGEISRLPVKLNDSIGIFPFAHESPDGARWAWHDWGDMSGRPKTYIGDAVAQPRVLSLGPEVWVYQIAWSPDSQHLLLFGTTGTFIAGQPDFEPVLAVQGWTTTDFTWVR